LNELKQNTGAGQMSNNLPARYLDMQEVIDLCGDGVQDAIVDGLADVNISELVECIGIDKADSDLTEIGGLVYDALLPHLFKQAESKANIRGRVNALQQSLADMVEG